MFRAAFRTRFGLKRGTKTNATGHICHIYSSAAGQDRLVEVGLLEDPKVFDTYQPKQLFLHKVFGYRGVVLFDWTIKVFDRDKQNPRISRSDWEKDGACREKMKELLFERQAYYQVLIDRRDFHQVRSPPEGITLTTTDDDDNSLYSISGLDYVSHDNVLPYLSTNNKSLPIHHDLYPQLFAAEDHLNQNYLSSWRQKNINWLQQVNVHTETTKNIKVTVLPFYMGCRGMQTFLHWWRYNIRIENLGSAKVQLRQRHWRIIGSSGNIETVRGEGIIGQQPILTPSQPAFQYSSHISLQSPNGHMWYAWDQVAQSLWKRYPNPHAKHVLSEDTIARERLQDGKLKSKRLMTKTNRIPKWTEKIIGEASQALLIEESVVDPVSKTFTTYTRNVTHTKMMSIIEKCTYYISPENKNWTCCLKEVWVKCNIYGITRASEKFGIERYKKNAKKAEMGLEFVIEKLINGSFNLIPGHSYQPPN